MLQNILPGLRPESGLQVYIVSEEAIVDEDAVQAVSNDLVHQGGSHSAVNTA